MPDDGASIGENPLPFSVSFSSPLWLTLLTRMSLMMKKGGWRRYKHYINANWCSSRLQVLLFSLLPKLYQMLHPVVRKGQTLVVWGSGA
jgi:hypothetical protein